MENLSADLRPMAEWMPPGSREEADQAILSLSNDIGLILAQLAEDQPAWCERTGRSPADYTAWRRRALFAKVHKEAQLRECKRLRAHLVPARNLAGTVQVPPELVARCRDVLRAWALVPDTPDLRPLAQAIARLAELLGVDTSPPTVVALPGMIRGAQDGGDVRCAVGNGHVAESSSSIGGDLLSFGSENHRDS